MNDKMLGQLYGLILKNCLITDYKISFSTKKPLEARKYLFLMRSLLNVDEEEFIYYLEDVQYGKDDSAIDKFRLFIPELLSRQLYLFHRPHRSKPCLTVIYYSSALPRILISMFKHLHILQQNLDFSRGFLDACLSNAVYSSERNELSFKHSRLTPFLINCLQVLGMYYIVDKQKISLINQHDLSSIHSLADIGKGRIHSFTPALAKLN
jgi:hypothetical protein